MKNIFLSTQLSLRTANLAHSAFASFVFSRGFFSSYSDGLEGSGERERGEWSEEEEEGEGEGESCRIKITIKVSFFFERFHRTLTSTDTMWT